MSYAEHEVAAIATAIKGLGAELLEVVADGGTPVAPLTAALAYAHHGWAVFPLHTPTGMSLRPCSCNQPNCQSVGKHPRTAKGLHAASLDPEQIHTWWRMWPQANVGIATGAASGLVVLDVDPRHGGQQSIATLEALVGPLPGTVTASTGTGWHLYYEHHRNPTWPTPCRGSAFGAELPGLDIRGDGGYVVAPPSVHVSGRSYTWAGSWRGQLAPWPLTLMWRHQLPPTAVPQPRYTRPPELWSVPRSVNALAGAARIVRTAAEGNRNNCLNWAAWCLAARVLEGALPEEFVREELITAALQAGLTTLEAKRTIASAFRAGGVR